MRVNVYAEEMTDRVEIIAKEIDGHKFTGLRFYLELPASYYLGSPGRANAGEVVPARVDGSHEPFQLQAPFIHRVGDDDSSAVTFWGKRDLRLMLVQALSLLDRHYAERDTTAAPNDSQLTDNGRVGTTQGSDEARTRTPRSAHPSQAATPLLTTGPSQEGAAGSAATPTAMRVALESHAEPAHEDALQKLSAHEHKQLEFYRNVTAAEPEKPVAWMYRSVEGAFLTTERRPADGHWIETPLYAAVPKGPMSADEQMLCESIMDEHVTAGPVSVIPVRAAVRAAYQAGKAAVQPPREPTKRMLDAAVDYVYYNPPHDTAGLWKAMYDAALKSAEGEK